VPAIRDLRLRADGLRGREVERARRALARGDAPALIIEQLAQSLTNKFIHAPLAALHDAASVPERERVQLTQAIERFYRGGGEA
jgi:glutamyl-tRNA reductase